MYRSEEVQRDCPVSECDGVVAYWTGEGENGPYADGSYMTWIFLSMDEPHACSNGHTFGSEEATRMEDQETEDYQSSVYDYEP